jgi:hypothetical protein
MWNDTIVEELHRFREQLAAEFDYDIGAIYRDIKRREEIERRKGRPFVSFSPRPLRSVVPKHRAG